MAILMMLGVLLFFETKLPQRPLLGAVFLESVEHWLLVFIPLFCVVGIVLCAIGLIEIVVR
jgi:hypothetical protein